MYKMTELQVRAGPAARAGARRPVHPARRPRAERVHERRALRRLDAGGPVLRRWPPASPRSTARCTAAPTSRRCGCSSASRRSRTSRTSSRASRAGDERLMGFGHRVYKNYDPRARIISKHLDEVFEVMGKSPLLEVAEELEKRAHGRRLLHVAQALPERRLLLRADLRGAAAADRACSRSCSPSGARSGWIAQWLEHMADSDQKIARPRQIYTGGRELDYVPVERALSPEHPQRPGAAWLVAKCNGSCLAAPPHRRHRRSGSGRSRPTTSGACRTACKQLSLETVRRRFLAAKPRFTRVRAALPDRGRRGRPHRARRHLVRHRAGSSPSPAPSALPDAPDIAEWAIVVADPLQGMGLGTLLDAGARRRGPHAVGIPRFSALIAGENDAVPGCWPRRRPLRARRVTTACARSSWPLAA